MTQTDDPSLRRRVLSAYKQRARVYNIAIGILISIGVLGGCFLFVRAAERVPSRSAIVPSSALCATLPGVAQIQTPFPRFCALHATENVTQQRVQRLRAYLDGYPMAQMADVLARQDVVVAAYMIAIAKQESQWGKRVPVLNGQDCYNYWGFRAKRKRMGTGGHTCFDSPEDAVETVGRRVHELVYDYGRTTPRQMLIWKCGRSCATHDPAGVERWVAVVARYHREVLALLDDADAPATDAARTFALAR